MDSKFMKHYSEDWEICVFCGFEACECNDTAVYETKEKWRAEIIELDNKIKVLQEAIKTTKVPPIPVFWAWKISGDEKCPNCGSKMSTYDGCCEFGESYLKFQYTKRFYPNALPILMEEVNGSNKQATKEPEAALPELYDAPQGSKKTKSRDRIA